MNIVAMTGKIAGIPKVTWDKKGNCHINFKIKVKRPLKGKDIYDELYCYAFGDIAEKLSRVLVGSWISVQGFLQTHHYEVEPEKDCILDIIKQIVFVTHADNFKAFGSERAGEIIF